MVRGDPAAFKSPAFVTPLPLRPTRPAELHATFLYHCSEGFLLTSSCQAPGQAPQHRSGEYEKFPMACSGRRPPKSGLGVLRRSGARWPEDGRGRLRQVRASFGSSREGLAGRGPPCNIVCFLPGSGRYDGMRPVGESRRRNRVARGLRGWSAACVKKKRTGRVQVFIDRCTTINFIRSNKYMR